MPLRHLIAAVIAAGAWLQAQEFRPSSLGDLVEAVGSNRDGLEDVDLTRDVADHAYFVFEAMSVAARFRDDPEGPLFVGWRHPGELWRYRFLDAAALASVWTGADRVRLGRVSGLRDFGNLLVLETATDSGATTVVMRRDLTPIAHVAGSAKLELPSDRFVLERAAISGGVRVETLAIADVHARRITTLYGAEGQSPSSRAFAAQAGSGPFELTIGAPQFDAAADALTFAVTFRSHPTSASVPPVQTDVAVTCRPLSSPAPVCLERGVRFGAVQ